MRVLTNRQMKEAEEQAMRRFGISSMLLMENAALNIVNHIEKNFSKKKKIAVLCGKGNNGGDGYAVARGLFARGYNVGIYPFGAAEGSTPDCKTNRLSAEAMGIPFEDDFAGLIGGADIVVDALIGTGLSRELSPELESVCAAVNACGGYVIAADCPTGVNSDTGERYKNAVKADVTFTFHRPKAGLLLFPAKENVGKLRTGSIGISDVITEGPQLGILTKSEAAKMLPPRDPNSNKGSFGRVAAFSGCDKMTGAAILCLGGAYGSGVGLAVGICTEKCSETVRGSLTEAIIKTAPDEDGCLTPMAYETAKEYINEKTTVLVGPGLGVSPSSKALVKTLVENIRGRLVIDADGLNCLCGFKDILRNAGGDIILTPHIGEMSRLSGKTAAQIKSDPINTALSFAKDYNVTIALKDAVTIIADPEGRAYINTTGTPAMSKGGTGDVLSGLIAGLSAQGLKSLDAAALGAYLNGLAGERAEKKAGSRGVLASMLCREIPKVMDRL